MTEPKYPMTTAGMVQPGFRIGGFTLRDGYGGVNKVWIECGRGEGGDFDAAELTEVIAAFYKKNF